MLFIFYVSSDGLVAKKYQPDTHHRWILSQTKLSKLCSIFVREQRCNKNMKAYTKLLLTLYVISQVYVIGGETTTTTSFIIHSPTTAFRQCKHDHCTEEGIAKRDNTLSSSCTKEFFVSQEKK
eukprot:7320644-Ditylum_brightwellii.AAC.1